MHKRFFKQVGAIMVVALMFALAFAPTGLVFAQQPHTVEGLRAQIEALNAQLIRLLQTRIAELQRQIAALRGERPLPPVTPAPTGWRTYRNATHGIEFQYPANLEIEDSSDARTGRVHLFRPGDREVLENRVFTFATAPLDTEGSIRQHIIRGSEREIFVGGLRGHQFRIADMRGLRAYIPYTLVRHRDRLYQFIGEGDTFDQILGTVVFVPMSPITLEPPPITTELRTYRNFRHGIEFQYPANLEIKASGDDFVDLFHPAIRGVRTFHFSIVPLDMEGHIRMYTIRGSEREIFVGGVRGIQFRKSDMSGQMAYIPITLVRHRDRLYQFIGTGVVFDQILATVRFIPAP